MQKILIQCPTCSSYSIKKNGLKCYGKQNYRCKKYGHQFIVRHELTYKGYQTHIDEFWIFVGNKKQKQWLIYAYDRETGGIVAYVWGKRDLITAKQLRQKLIDLNVSYDKIHIDGWDSFLVTFKEDDVSIGKCYIVGIEGNNTRLRHWIRRAFRKTCCFFKQLLNHLKAFDLVFHYINYGWV